MGSTYRCLAVDGEWLDVVRWFEDLDPKPIVQEAPTGHVLWFRSLGEIAVIDGEPVAKSSPIVNLFSPRRRRGLLWTAGEVHFLATHGTYSDLDRISRRFARWVGKFDEVHRSGIAGPWDYYLEGSIKAYDSSVVAMPRAMEALRAGTYFVSDDDNDVVVDRLCRKLALRGVQCDIE